MQYWLNRKSVKNNIIIRYENGLLLSSCNKNSYDEVDLQLKKNTNPIKLFGIDNLSLIPWSSIEEITSCSNDLNIELKYKIKEEDTIFLSFGHSNSKKKCLSSILEQLGDDLETTIDKRSAVSIYLNSVLSLVLAIGFTLLYYTLFPKASLIVGSIWALASIYRLFKLSRETKEVIYWKVKKPTSKKKKIHPLAEDSRVEEKFEMKTIYAFAGLSSVLFVSYFGLSILLTANLKSVPNSGNVLTSKAKSKKPVQIDGSTPLIRALNNNNEQLAISLIEQGANLTGQFDGRTALDIAIGDSLDNAVKSLLSKKAPSSNPQELLTRVLENDLGFDTIKKVVQSGADVNYIDDDGVSVLSIAMEHGVSNKVIRLLLKEGASTDIVIGGQTPVEYAKSNGNEKLAKLLSRY